MYNYIKGIITELDTPQLVIEANGIGYVVIATESLASGLEKGEQATIQVHLDVKETSLILYGFATTSERELFKTLLNVNGVGTKSAMAMLSIGSNALVSAISAGNSLMLSKIKGVSQKLADKVILDLRSKILKTFKIDEGFDQGQDFVKTQQNMQETVSSQVQDAMFGLLSLGMTKVRIQEILAGLDLLGKSAEQIIVEVLAKK